jgi:HTH-type transcriptional regulator, cell division transcriptional repressor
MRIFLERIFATIQVVKKNIIGDRVRQARRNAKPPITQLELVARLQSEGLSIDQSALSKMENGQRPITDIEVLAIAKALKVSVKWLFNEN